jgi:hypothetical protein
LHDCAKAGDLTMTEGAYDLDEAYQIHGPKDARRLYGDWAETYDESFGGPVLDRAGFGSALARMVALGQITPVAWRDIPICEGADHRYKDDRGLVIVFRRV